MIRNQYGYIMVETLISFSLFFFLIGSILGLVNIINLQSRVHFALTQTAEKISMCSYYGYVISENSLDPDQFIQSSREFQGVSGISQEEQTENSGNFELFSLFLELEEDVVKEGVLEEIILSFMSHYLKNGEQSGEEYLDSVYVVNGLNGFSLFSEGEDNDCRSYYDIEEGVLQIHLEYQVNWNFFGVPLPFSPTVEMSQGVKTKLWRGGKNIEYAT